jgi:hypothetical protein
VVGNASGRIFLCLLDREIVFRPLRYSEPVEKLFSGAALA